MNKKLLRKKLALMLANLKKKRPYYCEVEYLESTGTQYIDTGIAGSSTLKIEMDGQKTGASLGAYFGAGTGNSRIQEVYVNDYNSARIGDVTVVQLGPDTEKFNIVVDALSKKVIYNGTSYQFAYTSALTNLNIFIFTRNEGSSYTDKATAKCWLFKIWDNGTLVRDFIPVLDWNYVPCMYDKVTGQFFYNQGSGTFSYGREIHYVDYLESSGTQWVDTLYAFTDNFSWEIDFEGITTGSTIFGGRTSSYRTALLYQKSATQGTETACPIAGMTGDATPFQLTNLSTGRHKVKMSVASNKGSVWVDDVQVYNEQSFTGTYISGTTQGIFADNFGGGTVQEFTSSKVYALKMWQSGNIVRDFVPAIDENGVGFMFDSVTHSAYTNSGTGNFKYPSKEITYLETVYSASGNSWINTNYQPTNNTKVEFYANGISAATFSGSPSGTWLLGARQAYKNKMFGCYYDPSQSKLYLGFNNTLSIGSVSTSTMYGDDKKIVLDNTGLYINDVNVVVNSDSGSFTAPVPLTIFVLNNNGTAVSPSGYKLVYCKIWDNDTIVRDMIPVFQDGVAGVLDKVNNVFYSNAGIGTFTTGKIVEPEYE